MKKLFVSSLTLLLLCTLFACKKNVETEHESPFNVTELCGNYIDETNDRSLNISSNDGVTLLLSVIKTIDTETINEWIMNAHYDLEDLRYEYEEGIFRIYKINEGETAYKPELIYADGSGYIEIINGNILWHSDVQTEITDIIFIKEETKEKTSQKENNIDLNTYIGNYQDSVSERATLNITKGNNDSLNFVVSWSSSAEETTEWRITTIYNSETKHFDYQNALKTNITFIDEEENREKVYDDGTGYFMIDNEDFIWHTNVENDYWIDSDLSFSKID